ncbi:translation initiation factor IF-3 [Candidatus Woesebacteria bacterium]|nr:MAG: translation initiation factor IF-3 [Candidatus Woesebacteria bacterium]
MRNARPKQLKLSWRINHQIRSDKLRVVDESGKLIGVMGLPEALQVASEASCDLIEIAPKAVPPVAKVIEFGKFKYREEKKLKKQKKSAKGGEIKEIRFSPFIGEADYTTRLQKVNDFLKDGYKIRIVVKFKGRQMDSKKFGYNLTNRLLKDLTTNVVIDMEPKFLGRHLAMVISPTNKKIESDSENSEEPKKSNLSSEDI